MKVSCEWNGGLQFKGSAGNHDVLMDTVPPLGADTAMSPKQLLLAAVCGCTGMDIISLLKKYRQNVEALNIFADGNAVDTQPKIFTAVHLLFEVEGEVDAEKLKEAVKLSMTKYCSVSAMISKVSKIDYTIELNGHEIGKGEAQFEI